MISEQNYNHIYNKQLQKGEGRWSEDCLFSCLSQGGVAMKWRDAGEIKAAELTDEEFKTLREMSKKPKFDHFEKEKRKKKRKVKSNGVR